LIFGRLLGLQPPVIVFQANDIVLAEVVAVLYLNEQKGGGTNVLNAAARCARS
jgi:hypothetical protein